MLEKQKQTAGDGSINVQAGVIHLGVTYSEAKEIAEGVFDQNILKLRGIARDTATQRSHEINEAFLKRLLETNPTALNSATDPDFQHGLFIAQREFARSGNKDLGEILVDLLVDRADKTERDLLQIVLNEALETAPKLTQQQWDTLSLIFLVRYTRQTGTVHPVQIENNIRNSIKPFVGKLSKELSSFQHLEYAGCGAISFGEVSIERIYRNTYPGLFSKGFTEAELREHFPNRNMPQGILTTCFRDNTKLQVLGGDDDAIKEICRQMQVSDEDAQKLVALQNKYVMTDAEIKSVLEKVDDSMPVLFDFWKNSPAKSLTLTSVGIAIAHANIRRKIKANFDLRIWIK